jgi:drug/metabolite transporter (DMT)-like permease
MWIENHLSTLTNQTKGTLYCLVGIIILIPDSLILRELSNIPNFTIIFLKYLIFTLTYIVVYIALEGKNVFTSFIKIGWLGLLAGIIWGISNLLITYSFLSTAVANALVINLANPMFSALFSWIILKENIPMRTIIASLISFGAIILIFYSQLGSTGSTSNTIGLICAMIASACMGLFFVILRLAAGKEGYVQYLISRLQ